MEKSIHYIPAGVCSQTIDITVEDGIVKDGADCQLSGEEREPDGCQSALRRDGRDPALFPQNPAQAGRAGDRAVL